MFYTDVEAGHLLDRKQVFAVQFPDLSSYQISWAAQSRGYKATAPSSVIQNLFLLGITLTTTIKVDATLKHDFPILVTSMLRGQEVKFPVLIFVPWKHPSGGHQWYEQQLLVTIPGTCLLCHFQRAKLELENCQCWCLNFPQQDRPLVTHVWLRPRVELCQLIQTGSRHNFRTDDLKQNWNNHDLRPC